MSISWLPPVAACVLTIPMVIVALTAALLPNRFRSRLPLVSTAAADGPRFCSVLFSLGCVVFSVLLIQTGGACHAIVLAGGGKGGKVGAGLIVGSVIVHLVFTPLAALGIALCGVVNYTKNDALLHAGFSGLGICAAIVMGIGNTVLMAEINPSSWVGLKIVGVVGMFVFSCAFGGMYSAAHEGVSPEDYGRGEKAFVVHLDEDERRERGGEGGELVILPRSLLYAAASEYLGLLCFALFVASMGPDLAALALVVR